MNSPYVPHDTGVRWPWLLLSLLAATLFNLAPWPLNPVIPDLLALTLTLWSLRHPRPGMLLAAFGLGLLMDVQRSVPLGEHALLYTLISCFTILLHRRLRCFSIAGQMPHLLLVFATAQAIVAAARLLAEQPLGGAEQFLVWLSTTLLWPLASLLMLGPAGSAPPPRQPRTPPHLAPTPSAGFDRPRRHD